MGDTYYIKKVECAFCNKFNNFANASVEFMEIGLPYNNEFGGEFVCISCNKLNQLRMDLVAIRPNEKDGVIALIGRMEKDFDKWNKEKKLVDAKQVNKNLFFYQREIWWCNAGLNIGVEANGKNENFERPVLIIRKFNAEMVWVLPLTTKDKVSKYYFKLEHEEIKSWVILSQIKTISTKRLLRKIGSISVSDFREVVLRVQGLLKIEYPLSGVFSEAEATNKTSLLDSEK